jgi:hypothetical protein
MANNKKNKKTIVEPEKTADLPLKKRRGRPKKVVEPVKRGRGRPRKEPPKRGRGRPKKEQPKRGRGRPPKKVEKRGRPRKYPVKKSKKSKRIRGVSQYALLQHALKKYCQDNNLKLGRNFNSAASAIWKQRPEDSKMTVGYWEKHIRSYDKLVDLRSFIPGAEQEYSIEDFGTTDFWHFSTEMNDFRRTMPGLYVIIEFEDTDEWNFEGSIDEADEWFKNGGLLRHLRETYAYAQLTPIEAGQGYVKYTFKNLEGKESAGTRPEGTTRIPEPTESESIARARIEADKDIKIKQIEAQERQSAREAKIASFERMFEKGLMTKAEYIDAVSKL